MSKRIIFITVMAAGSIVMLIGLYYSVIKAGIPYQDPTPELLAEYNRNMQTGETLCLIGFSIISVSIIICAVYKICRRLTAR